MDHIDAIWVPESFNQSRNVLKKYCPAGSGLGSFRVFRIFEVFVTTPGSDESKVDFDVSLTAASLNQFCGKFHLFSSCLGLIEG